MPAKATQFCIFLWQKTMNSGKDMNKRPSLWRKNIAKSIGKNYFLI